MMINCCQNCEKRTIGCHETCPVYLEARKQHKADKLKIRAEKQQQVLCYSNTKKK